MAFGRNNTLHTQFTQFDTNHKQRQRRTTLSKNVHSKKIKGTNIRTICEMLSTDLLDFVVVVGWLVGQFFVKQNNISRKQKRKTMTTFVKCRAKYEKKANFIQTILILVFKRRPHLHPM